MKKYNTQSKVEDFFVKKYQGLAGDKDLQKIPVVITDNYVELGQLTALRFLEWTALNPGGVIALPTGKTPEFFIKWVQYYLDNWQKEMKLGLLAKIGLDPMLKPDLKSLHFFQIDEFFPINPSHERSFNYFIKKFYIEGFGLNPEKVRLIDTYNLPKPIQGLPDNYSNVYQVFGDESIDFTLRTRQPANSNESYKQIVLKHYDQFCQEYEDEIRTIGGIGFFLGGIGPDGHIAFNIKGSDHHSHTRLTDINYETQATAATDLGGIELVKRKAVITIGLETVTYNPDTVAIIIAAGEAKAKLVANAIENIPSTGYPATALQKLSNSQFFITRGASVKLNQKSDDLVRFYKINPELSRTKAEEIIIRSALANNMSLEKIVGLKEPEQPDLKVAVDLSQMSINSLVKHTIQGILDKITTGLNIPKNCRFLHTGPHHDDIELAYFPYLHHLVRRSDNDNYFVYCTSGFTSVTDFYLKDCLINLKNNLASGIIENNCNPDVTELAQEDITGYLKGIALQDRELQHLFVSARLARKLMEYKKLKKSGELPVLVEELISLLNSIEAGRKEPEIIHYLKACLREFEAELVWAHFGIGLDHVFHLHLPFYTDDIFPEYPNFESDVQPIYALLEKVNPDVISLALDPEGSGPDTHYKTLIALSEAIHKYAEKYPEKSIKIWGYRNVWSRFKITDVNCIIPVSLNSFGVLHSMFNHCFISQKSASFPSYELDGTFSELAQKIWVEQHNDLARLLGKDSFYNSKDPMLRRAFGAIYLKVMTWDEFEQEIKPLKRLLHAKEELKK